MVTISAIFIKENEKKNIRKKFKKNKPNKQNKNRKKNKTDQNIKQKTKTNKQYIIEGKRVDL